MMRAEDLRPDDVVVTGRGVVCPIGNTVEEIVAPLREGRSGVEYDTEFEAHGFRSRVSGRIRGLDGAAYFSETQLLSMSRASLYSSVAAVQAVREARLEPRDLEREASGIVLGSGIGGLGTNYRMYDILREQKSPRRVGSHGVDTTMSSTCAANASVLFRTQGVGEALSSACATGLHCIGYAYRLIRHGYQDTVIAGAADEDGWATAFAFDAMRVLCADSNDRPWRASRPLDASRSGFVASGGAGVVVLEKYARAKQRGARPLARIRGYWSSTDGSGDMTAPSPSGQQRLLRAALRNAEMQAGDIDYVNLHGTATPTGDTTEVSALVQVLGNRGYGVSSSKSQIGHALGAAGAIEFIFCLSMLEHGFMAPSINIERLDPSLKDYEHLVVTRTVERPLRCIMSNNFGFGSTNGSIIVEGIA
ncbi:beta-ketoacyl-[acyl-carrier-protein] synthase family protein [Pendulispora brunnea]|uniref:3-oxoacyl-[acyl-carrier-protein] synthase 1 n=1 Tax=Pendulispora brunnea TaxID=2905690 RepID=A0ABZ2K6D0_9BACT